jgi:hypothetical protein
VYIASNSNKVLERLPHKLAAQYKLKTLGVPRQLLGVEIKWTEDFSTGHISIKKLIVALLAQCGMLSAEPKSTPLEPGIQFYKKDLPTKEEILKDKKLQIMQKKYRQVVGTFIFICGTCRPDIMYAVHVLCRIMANPSQI